MEETLLIAAAKAAGDAKAPCVSAVHPRTGVTQRMYRNGSCQPNTLAVSGKYVATSQHERAAIHIWKLSSELTSIRIPTTESITALAMSDDGLHCAAGGESGMMYLWEIPTGVLLFQHNVHFRSVTCLKFSRDGSVLFSSSSDATIKAWNVAELLSMQTPDVQPKPMRSWSCHTLPITALCLSSGPTPSLRLFTAARDRLCNLIDFASGSVLATVSFSSDLTCADVDPAQRFLFLGGGNGTLFRLALANDRFVGGHMSHTEVCTSVQAHRLAIASVACSLSGELVATSSVKGDDKSMCVWDINSLQPLRSVSDGVYSSLLFVPKSMLSVMDPIPDPVLFARQKRPGNELHGVLAGQSASGALPCHFDAAVPLVLRDVAPDTQTQQRLGLLPHASTVNSATRTAETVRLAEQSLAMGLFDERGADEDMSREAVQHDKDSSRVDQLEKELAEWKSVALRLQRVASSALSESLARLASSSTGSFPNGDDDHDVGIAEDELESMADEEANPRGDDVVSNGSISDASKSATPKSAFAIKQTQHSQATVTQASTKTTPPSSSKRRKKHKRQQSRS